MKRLALGLVMIAAVSFEVSGQSRERGEPHEILARVRQAANDAETVWRRLDVETKVFGYFVAIENALRDEQRGVALSNAKDILEELEQYVATNNVRLPDLDPTIALADQMLKAAGLDSMADLATLREEIHHKVVHRRSRHVGGALQDAVNLRRSLSMAEQLLDEQQRKGEEVTSRGATLLAAASAKE